MEAVESIQLISGITGQWEDNVQIALDDLLWDGDGCGLDNNCCNQTGMPWFYRILPQEVGDDIEVRLCANEDIGNEEICVDLVEIYVDIYNVNSGSAEAYRLLNYCFDHYGPRIDHSIS